MEQLGKTLHKLLANPNHSEKRIEIFLEVPSFRFVRHLRWCFVLLAAALLTLRAPAQTSTGSITGRVTDPAGALLVGAKVSLRQEDTGLQLTTRTNRDGVYVFSSLQPGPFLLHVDEKGFGTATEAVVLSVNQTAELDVQMSVGTIEMIVVNATTQLDVQDSGVSLTIPGSEVQDLPLNGRNPYGLAALAPGIVPGDDFGAGLSTTREAVVAAATNNFQTNGGIGGHNEILLDGISIVVCCQGQPPVTPTVEVVNQFKVITSVPQAQFGRSSGGVLDIVTRNGTNRLRGDIYEYLRNDKLDAAPYFVKRAGIYPIPNRHDFRLPLRFNQFGGFVSGPVVLPHVYDGHDKTFFAFGYEGIRSLKTSSNTTTVPTPLMRQGIFTEAPNLIYDPSSAANVGGVVTRTPIAAGCNMSTCYPAGRYISNINPVASHLLSFLPSSNISTITSAYVNNYLYFPEIDSNDDQFNLRIDENINAAQRLFFRGTRVADDYNQQGLILHAVNPNTYYQRIVGYLFASGYTWTVTPSFLVQLTYGFNYQYNHQTPGNYGLTSSDYGFSSQYASEQQTSGLPYINISNLQTLGTESANLGDHYTHVLGASVTVQAGKHSIIAGYDGRYILENQQGFDDNGAFTFDSTFTNGPNAGNAAATGQVPFDAFAAFLLGDPTTASLIRQTTVAFSQPYNAVYLQDTWRVAPKATLNLGLRFGIEPGFRERHNHWADFDPNAQNPLSSSTFPVRGGAQYLGQPNQPSRTWLTTYGLGPRVGLVVAPQPSFVVRGAFGILFLPTSQRAFESETLGYSQTSIVQGNPSTTPSFTFANPFPNGVTLPQGAASGVQTGTGGAVGGFLYNTPDPYQEQWNIGIQQGFSSRVDLRLDYVGGHGVKLPILGRPNDLQPQYFGAVGDLKHAQYLQTPVSNPFYGTVKSGTLANKTVALQQLLSAYPQYGPAQAMTSSSVGLFDQASGSASYNSLQTSLLFRGNKNLVGSVAYIWSKLLGDVTDLTTSSLNTEGSPTYQNYYLIKGHERSNLVSDRPQRVVGSAIYLLPFGRGQRFGGTLPHWADALAGGWQLNAIGFVQSGTPLVYSQTGGQSYSPTRPSFVPGINPNTSGPLSARLGGAKTTQAYLNPGAFRLSQAFELSNIPFAAAMTRSPAAFGDDLSIKKKFAITDTSSLEFRFEAFNVLNKVQFGVPNTQFGEADFGEIDYQGNTPRQVQLALKLYF